MASAANATRGQLWSSSRRPARLRVVSALAPSRLSPMPPTVTPPHQQQPRRKSSRGGAGCTRGVRCPLSAAGISATTARSSSSSPRWSGDASLVVGMKPLRSTRGALAAAASVAGGASDADAALSLAKLGKYKVVELREELAKRGAPVGGLKAELVGRLHALLLVEERFAEIPSSSNDEERAPTSTNIGGDGEGSASPVMPPPPAMSGVQQQLDQQREQRGAPPPRPAIQRTMFNSRTAEKVSGGEEIGEEADTNFSGMEVTFLGTSSGSPSFTRNVSSYALRLNDEIWLFDCGEATQHQLMRSHLKYTKITRIFITHMHGDHIFGLPGLICALSGGGPRRRHPPDFKSPVCFSAAVRLERGTTSCRKESQTLNPKTLKPNTLKP